MLQVMETQLAQLSKIIRSHQAEIDQLRQALTAGCAERQQLQQQLQQVLQQQQHAQLQLQPQAPRMQGCNPPLNKLLPSPSLGTSSSSSSRDGGSDLKAKVSALHSVSSSTTRVASSPSRGQVPLQGPNPQRGKAHKWRAPAARATAAAAAGVTVCLLVVMVVAALMLLPLLLLLLLLLLPPSMRDSS